MIYVLVERYIADGLEPNYEATAKEVLRQAFKAQGFLSGETFQDSNDPSHRYVMSKWRSLSEWHQWRDSSKRQAVMNRLLPILKEPETVKVLTHS